MNIVAQVSQKFRIVCDGRQWILQVARGQATSKNTGWRSLKFVTGRRALEAALKSCLGTQYSGAVSMWVQDLPDILPSRNASEWSASFFRPDGLPILLEGRNGLADAPFYSEADCRRTG